jgi:hypothetical protein
MQRYPFRLDFYLMQHGCPVRASALTIVLTFLPEPTAQVDVAYGSARQPMEQAVETTKRRRLLETLGKSDKAIKQ